MKRWMSPHTRLKMQIVSLHYFHAPSCTVVCRMCYLFDFIVYYFVLLTVAKFGVVINDLCILVTSLSSRAAIEATDFFSDRHLIELVGSLLHVYTKRMCVCVCVPWCVQRCGTAGSRGGRGGTETRRRKKRWRRLSSLTSSSSFCVILIGRGAGSKRGWVWKPFSNDHPGLIGRFSFSY